MSQWTHLRVRAGTAARLRAYILALMEQADKGRETAILPDRDPINPAHLGMSADAALARLLDLWDAKRRRNVEYERRRKERRERRKGSEK